MEPVVAGNRWAEDFCVGIPDRNEPCNEPVGDVGDFKPTGMREWAATGGEDIATLAADALEPRRLVPVGVLDDEPAAAGTREDDSVEYLRFALPPLLPMLLTGMADDDDDGETGNNGAISFVGVVPF